MTGVYADYFKYCNRMIWIFLQASLIIIFLNKYPFVINREIPPENEKKTKEHFYILVFLLRLMFYIL